MKKKTSESRLFTAMLIIFSLLSAFCNAQEADDYIVPFEIDLYGLYQKPFELRGPDSGWGYGGGVEFRYDIGHNFYVNLNFAVERMNLEQDDVLDEWDWAYWEDTYIEFIPGATVDEINKTLRYTDNDQYWAVFKPVQSMNEIRFSLGTGYKYNLSNEFQINLNLNLGFNSYERKLLMQEDWIKRVIISVDSVTVGNEVLLDTTTYDYKFDLLHAAPSHKGNRLLINPVLNLNYDLGSSIRFFITGSYMAYLNKNSFSFLNDLNKSTFDFKIKKNYFRELEKLLGISAQDDKRFPLRSKVFLSAGLIFNY